MKPITSARDDMANAFDPSRWETLSAETLVALQRRDALLGPAYRLFYEEPFAPVRGRGVFLYDAEGREYLDAYNNVLSLGHSHPRVAEAIRRQAEMLCTHTRYLDSKILDYAEALLATFDPAFSKAAHLMFTCTGSESNDLATRIAMHHTGRRGVIVTAQAYHGTSFLTAGFSPSLGVRSPLGPWVRTVPAPDSYRIPRDEVGLRFRDAVEAQILDLERHGDGVAALVTDSAFSSDGLYTHPVDVLGPAADLVRQHGGLVIADEVQSGFGRLGDSFWGHQRHGVVPDLVTLGKPMGNGFPVGGVAVNSTVVRRFAEATRYFNTFGGNHLAIAAAQATLATIQSDSLVQNSSRVGAILREGIEAIATEHGSVGDVRGSGLYLGLELVRNRDTREPDPAMASAIVNGLRRRRVLISATGPHANTLKIRPPLVFDEGHVGRFLQELEGALRDAGA